MRFRYIALGFVPLILTGSFALASSGGAPASRTGALAVSTTSAEGTCRSCHSDYALDDGITVTLVNAPNAYVAGNTYTFSVQVASSNTAGSSGRRWAFELTAVNMTDGKGVGTFTAVPGQGTQIITGNSQYSTRQYVECTTYATGSTPKSWQVQWTAPNTGAGPVGFFASGVAANGNGAKSGDWVGVGSLITQDITPVEASTWGKVKLLYR